VKAGEISSCSTHLCKWKNDICCNYPRNGGREMKENSGGDAFKNYIFDKNFCKCHNVPIPSTTIKKLKNIFSCARTVKILHLEYGSV
jgi:hypothetical protein